MAEIFTFDLDEQEVLNAKLHVDQFNEHDFAAAGENIRDNLPFQSNGE